MSTLFYLYVVPEQLAGNDDEISVTAHHMIGYCPQTIPAYQAMAATLRETFPQAKDGDIGCHQIVKSDRYKGFTLVAWQGHKVSRKTLGLPAAKGYAALVTKMKEDHPTWTYPTLPEYRGWYVTAHRISYNW